MDIEAVTGGTAKITDTVQTADIIIGTIGKSRAVDKLIAENKLDVSAVENEWEAFTLQNVEGVLVIAGADKRGTIYGIYDLSEKMGVSPWVWWADVDPVHSDEIYVMVFNVRDNNGNRIENEHVKLLDKKFGTVIDMEDDGTYHLCGGVYSYEISADGYITVNSELKLSQATESKTISVQMIRA